MKVHFRVPGREGGLRTNLLTFLLGFRLDFSSPMPRLEGPGTVPRKVPDKQVVATRIRGVSVADQVSKPAGQPAPYEPV